MHRKITKFGSKHNVLRQEMDKQCFETRHDFSTAWPCISILSTDDALPAELLEIPSPVVPCVSTKLGYQVHSRYWIQSDFIAMRK